MKIQTGSEGYEDIDRFRGLRISTHKKQIRDNAAELLWRVDCCSLRVGRTGEARFSLLSCVSGSSIELRDSTMNEEEATINKIYISQ